MISASAEQVMSVFVDHTLTAPTDSTALRWKGMRHIHGDEHNGTQADAYEEEEQETMRVMMMWS